MGSRKTLILASHSPRRARLLTEAGYRFDVVPADIEEPALAEEMVDPESLAQALAYFKARQVADRCGPDKIVLAADTIVAVEHNIVGKADDADHARKILKTLSHNTHQVISGVAVIDADSDRRRISFAATTVTMKPMSDDEIDDYIATGSWRDKAGAYAIQQGADKYIANLDGSFTNVVGLPMELVQRMLSAFDIHPEKP